MGGRGASSGRKSGGGRGRIAEDYRSFTWREIPVPPGTPNNVKMAALNILAEHKGNITRSKATIRERIQRNNVMIERGRKIIAQGGKDAKTALATQKILTDTNATLQAASDVLDKLK